MKLFSPGPSLRQKVVHAGFWSFGLHIADRLFSLGRIIVLARLLSPNDFGLFGIAALAMTGLETFSRTGFHMALIQKKEDIRPYLDVAWTVQVLRGVFLALLLFITAPYVADFFGEPAAIPLLQLLGLSMIFEGFSNIGIVFFRKELEFHKQFAYRFSGTVGDMVVAISAAVVLQDARALLLGNLARRFVEMVVSYLAHPYRPRFRLDKQKFKDLFQFGIWVSFVGMMVFIGSYGGGIVVGRLIGVTALGLYQMAYRIPQMIIRQLLSTISNVAFPAYAKLQTNAVRMQEGYLRIAGFSLALTMPMAIGIVMIGGDFIRIFLGEKWMPMVPALALLTVGALLKSIAQTGTPAFMGQGSPQIVFHMQLARAATLVVLIYPFSILWGISGAALAVTITGASMLTVWYIKIKRQLGLTLKDIRDMIGPPLISSMAMAAVLYVIRELTVSLRSGALWMDIVWFTAMILVSMVIYGVGMVLCQRIFPESPLIQDAVRVVRGKMA